MCMWASPFLVTLALAILIDSSSAASVFSHPLSKRSFFDINCRGVYDKSIYARLDRVCQDCYNLYREPELHTLCRGNCFSNKFFNGCLESLLLQDESPTYSNMIDILGRK